MRNRRAVTVIAAILLPLLGVAGCSGGGNQHPGPAAGSSTSPATGAGDPNSTYQGRSADNAPADPGAPPVGTSPAPAATDPAANGFPAPANTTSAFLGIRTKGNPDDLDLVAVGCSHWPDVTGALIVSVGGTPSFSEEKIVAYSMRGGKADKVLAYCVLKHPSNTSPAEIKALDTQGKITWERDADLAPKMCPQCPAGITYGEVDPASRTLIVDRTPLGLWTLNLRSGAINPAPTKISPVTDHHTSPSIQWNAGRPKPTWPAAWDAWQLPPNGFGLTPAKWPLASWATDFQAPSSDQVNQSLCGEHSQFPEDTIPELTGRTAADQAVLLYPMMDFTSGASASTTAWLPRTGGCQFDASYNGGIAFPGSEDGYNPDYDVVKRAAKGSTPILAIDSTAMLFTQAHPAGVGSTAAGLPDMSTPMGLVSQPLASMKLVKFAPTAIIPPTMFWTPDEIPTDSTSRTTTIQVQAWPGR